VKRAFRLLQLGVTVAVFAIIMRRVDVHAAWNAITTASPWWIALALATNLLAVCASTALWRALMPAPRPSFARLWRAYVAGMFYNNLGLGTVVGDAYRYAQISRTGSGAAAVSVVGERIVSAAALVAFAALGSLYFAGSHPLLPLCVSTGAAGGVLLIAGTTSVAPRCARHLRIPDAAARRLRPLHSAARDLVRNPRALASASVYAVCVQICTVAAALFVMRALGVSLSPLEVFAVVPLIALTVLLPVSVQGIGVREAMYVSLFALVGVARDQALAAALLSYATTLALTLTGGAFALWSVRPASAPTQVLAPAPPPAREAA
jgi:uncharacterized membrane protein YbhN (UPF0104 family)